MISRSLGPEFGAAIGIIFAVANAIAVALHTTGFCESLNDLLRISGVKIIDNAANDTRIIGSVTLIVIAAIVSIGMEWEAKVLSKLLNFLNMICHILLIILGSTGAYGHFDCFSGKLLYRQLHRTR